MRDFHRLVDAQGMQDKVDGGLLVDLQNDVLLSQLTRKPAAWALIV